MSRSSLLFFILATSLLLFASSQECSENWQLELDNAKAVWEATGIVSYGYQYNAICFCFPPGPYVIEVLDCTVDSVSLLSEEFDPPSTDQVSTVEELFTQLQQILVLCSGSFPPYSYSVSFDQEYGYPSNVNIDRELLAIDEEIIYSVSNFTVIKSNETGCATVPVVTNAPTPGPVVTNAPTPSPVITNVPTRGPVITNAPTPGPVVTNAPTPGPVVTNAPTPGPVITNAPTRGPVVTNAPTPGPVGTNAPTPSPVSTNAPTPNPFSTNEPTPSPVSTNAPTPNPVSTNAPSPGPSEEPIRPELVLLDGDWIATSGTFDGQELELVGCISLTIEGSLDGPVNGLAACNDYRAQFEIMPVVAPDSIAFSAFSWSEETCRDDTEALQQTFIESLKDTFKYEHPDGIDSLRLTGNKSRWVFERKSPDLDCSPSPTSTVPTTNPTATPLTST